jgi:hypothetical protein
MWTAGSLTCSRSAHASAGRSPYIRTDLVLRPSPGACSRSAASECSPPRSRARIRGRSCIAPRVPCCTTIASLSQRKGAIVMVQQGQVSQMTSRAADGSALWSYRYRIGGRDSRRCRCTPPFARSRAAPSWTTRLSATKPTSRAWSAGSTDSTPTTSSAQLTARFRSPSNDNEAGANANSAAANWIRENLPDLGGSAPQVSSGEVVIST